MTALNYSISKKTFLRTTLFLVVFILLYYTSGQWLTLAAIIFLSAFLLLGFLLNIFPFSIFTFGDGWFTIKPDVISRRQRYAFSDIEKASFYKTKILNINAFSLHLKNNRKIVIYYEFMGISYAQLKKNFPISIEEE